MDWPDADGSGAHLDKRLRDDYDHADWASLVGRYGEASVVWVWFASAVWFDHLGKGGGE